MGTFIRIKCGMIPEKEREKMIDGVLINRLSDSLRGT